MGEKGIARRAGGVPGLLKALPDALDHLVAVLEQREVAWRIDVREIAFQMEIDRPAVEDAGSCERARPGLSAPLVGRLFLLECVFDLGRWCTRLRRGADVRQDLLGRANCCQPLEDADVATLAGSVLPKEDSHARVEGDALIGRKAIHVCDVAESANHQLLALLFGSCG